MNVQVVQIANTDTEHSNLVSNEEVSERPEKGRIGKKPSESSAWWWSKTILCSVVLSLTDWLHHQVIDSFASHCGFCAYSSLRGMRKDHTVELNRNGSSYPFDNFSFLHSVFAVFSLVRRPQMRNTHIVWREVREGENKEWAKFCEIGSHNATLSCFDIALPKTFFSC